MGGRNSTGRYAELSDFCFAFSHRSPLASVFGPLIVSVLLAVLTRHSTSSGKSAPSRYEKDPRDITNKAYVQQNVRTLLNYLSSHDYTQRTQVFFACLLFVWLFPAS